MLIQMLADRFEAGGVLRAKGTQVDVATDLALRWIGDNAAAAVGLSREVAQGIRKDVPVVQDQVSSQQTAAGAPVSGGGISGLDNDKLSQLFGDDQMLIGTFANRPLASTVASGKEFAASDLGYCRWVSDGTQWILLKPGNLLNMATPSSITDSVGQATTESTLLTLNIPANALGANDGLELDLLWSCTNTAAAKRLRARFGGTVLFNVDLTTHLVFRQSVKLRNRNSQSAQVSQGNSVTNFGPIGSVGAQTFTADLSVAQALTITGQFPVTGSSANTLTLEEATIRAI